MGLARTTKYRIEKLADGQWRSVFPQPFEDWSRTHDTCTLAYDYMRKDAGVTSYIEVVPLKSEDA
jgi:hypothetical protein